MSVYKKGSLAARVDADLRREQSLRIDAIKEKEKAKQHVCHICDGLALNEDFKLRPGVFICAACYDRIIRRKEGIYDDPDKV